MTARIKYFLPVFLAVFIFSCKKKTPEDIGLPLLPGGDLLNAEFTDTVTLITHTVSEDSVPSKNVTPTLLGNMNDALFGITKASFFTQLVLSKANPSFGTNPVLDSAVLSVVYSSGQYYGNLYPQKFKVYELTQALSKDSSYQSNKMLEYGTELGSAYLVPKPNPATDSVTIADTLEYPPHLRIHLDKNYFQNFFAGKPADFYTGNTAFQGHFKGLYVASASGPPSGQGSILYMDLLHNYSRLTLFYHNDTDTLSYHFYINKDNCTRFTHFEHDYSSSAEITAQLNSDPSIQKDKIFVQAMAGLRAKVTMPFLQDLFNNGKIAINKAELVLPIDPTSVISGSDSLDPHPKLVATIADSVLGPVIMPDYFEGATYFGGEYNDEKMEYRFNIGRYVQQVLNGTRANQGLYIITNARPTSANRVVLNGGSKSLSNRMRLNITYTPLY